ncbi:amyloid-beta A4 precursor protein-binding family A member 2-like [Moschus berezovskii]|uniref:amyloid-beta A4 precursor protein-binding family A member 2-like n=1 Tax=Moschus berezovskii TaxID=68408 RepID=UPI00244382A7|nr:amyloid-beta A4 precursor protein-binding family A member 2-like [Moschus berezovskii]
MQTPHERNWTCPLGVGLAMILTPDSAEWLPPGDDGRMSPTMAHWKHQSAVSSQLDHRMRLGPEPKSKDVEELALEEYVPTGLELAALWPERPLPAQKGGPDGYLSSN